MATRPATRTSATVATALAAAKRLEDSAARSGGDEFAMFLPNTGLDEASSVALRLCRVMHGVAVDHGQARISVGCAAGAATDDPFVVWAAADEALYRAKREGRDRVRADGGETAGPGTTVRRWEPVLRSLQRAPGIVPAFQPTSASPTSASRATRRWRGLSMLLTPGSTACSRRRSGSSC
jgi:predicted signal transduction protein with EAL and GGDEF domain